MAERIARGARGDHRGSAQPRGKLARTRLLQVLSIAHAYGGILLTPVARFGKLRLHGQLRVSRDRASWQELECFLFAEMLICIKEKRGAQPLYADGNSKRKLTKCTLRGSILIRKHLKEVESSPGECTVTYAPKHRG